MKKILFKFALAISAFASISTLLLACASGVSLVSVEKNISGNHKFTKMQNFKQFGLLAMNQNGSLMQYNSNSNLWKELVKDLDPNSNFYATDTRISLVSKDGYYWLYENNQLIKSTIKVSKKGGFAHLGIATIIVGEENGKYYLTRVNKNSNSLSIDTVNKDKELIETAVPVQVNFSGLNNNNGHIAVLVKPDKTYKHYVLGIEQNPTELMFVERHDLKTDLATPLISENNSVFEDNQPRIIMINNNNYYLAVIQSNATEGANVILIRPQNNKLTIIAKTPTIEIGFRWNSPMIINDNLYVTKTPHIGGVTFSYEFINNSINLKETEFAKGISPHLIGQYKTATYGFNSKYLFVPSNDWKQLKIIDLINKTITTKDLPDKIKDIATNKNFVYVVLK